MLCICQKSFNPARNIQRSNIDCSQRLVKFLKNLNQNEKHRVRDFTSFENQRTSLSKWNSTFNNIGPPERLTGIRLFRQKVPPSSGGKPGPVVKQTEIPKLEGRGEISATWSTLRRPLLFTIAFGACSFGGAAIWQYENMRQTASANWKRKKSTAHELLQSWGMNGPMEKSGKIRQELNKYWNQLSEGEKIFLPILGLNVLVFGLWRVPSLQPLMYRYFAANPQISNSGLPMLLSAFSHCSFLHLACNMFVLHSFSGPIVSALGKEQFVGLYLSSSVLTSFFSHVSKIASGRMGSSLGASGAICTVLGVFGTLVPDARMQIILLPFFTFTASMGIKALMAIDTAGLIAGWQIFDHAAHLSGVLFGIWWCHQGHELIWHRRGVLMNWWHENVRDGKHPPSER